MNKLFVQEGEAGNGNPPSRQQNPVPTEKDPVDKPADKK